MFEGDEDHDEIAQQWTQKYEEDNSEAMKDMVNFILKVSLACIDSILLCGYVVILMPIPNSPIPPYMPPIPLYILQSPPPTDIPPH